LSILNINKLGIFSVIYTEKFFFQVTRLALKKWQLNRQALHQ